MYEQLSNLAKSFVQALPRLGAWLFVFCLFFVNHFWAVLLGILAIYCTVFLAMAIWTVAIELYSEHAASIFHETSAIR